MHTNLFRNALLLLTLIAFSTGCALSKNTLEASEDKELHKLAQLLIGDFSSKQQAKEDSDYFDISLSMSRIWEDKQDGVWLYVEQALASKKEAPYRQRVYKLSHPSSDLFISEIFTIKTPEKFIGLQNDPQKKQLLNPELIELKAGCTVKLSQQGGIYQGGTEGEKCPSDLRGASYATTKITLTSDVLESWDQGFDASGKQVWGATKAGYKFVRE